jgi:pimeloyl-ACP methyl ester carboxylesterase
MAVYVLVHGAWHGGWCWRRVAPRLRAAGHEVYAPTLTGLGERAHLLSPAVDLDTHAADVLGVLQYEDLRGAVLVGHSYGGMVITAVAERAAGRLARLVYLDAFLPRDGECLLDLFPPGAQAQTLARARAEGAGWYLPPQRGAHPYGVTDPADIAWVRSKFTAHPMKTMQQPVRRAAPAARALPRAFVACTATGWFAGSAARARAEGGWDLRELDAVHDAMVTAPQALTDVLLDLAGTL